MLSLVSLLCLVESAAFVNVSLSTALPEIINHFHTKHGGWLLTAGALTAGPAAPLIGKLADLYGKRRMIIILVLVASVGEILAATATGFWAMIAAHVLLSVLVGMLFLCYSLIRDVYPPRLVPFAASLSVTGMGVLLIGAPFLIGELLDRFGFRSLYLFNLAWLIVMAAILLLTTPETSVRRSARIDLPGAVLLAGGFVLILLPISMGAEWGWTSARVIGLLIGGAAVIGLYVVVSLRVREPVLNLRVLARRGVLSGVLGGGMGHGLAAVISTLLALLAMTPRELGGTYGLGYSATEYALVSAPSALGSVAAGIVVGVLARRFSTRPLMYAGLGMTAFGALVLMLEHDTYGKMVTAAVIMGVGLGLALAAMPNMIIEDTPAMEQGSMASAGGLSAGVIGGVMSTVVFAIMTPTAKSPVPGVVVYGDSGISDALLAVAAAAFVALLIQVIFLRPRRGDTPAKRPATSAPVDETPLPA